MKPFSLIFTLVGLVSSVVAARAEAPPGALAPQPQATEPAAALPTVAASPLRRDPALAGRVSLEATARPLRDVLRDLSANLPLDLTARSGIGEHRVTLHVSAQPLYQVMERLAGLLSHSPAAAPPRGYAWEKTGGTGKERPGYQMWRDAAAVADEKAALDAPRREALQQMRDMRNLARLPRKERAGYHSNFSPAVYDTFDLHPHFQALKNLSDAQIESLLSGAEITISAAPLKDALSAQWYSLWKNSGQPEGTPIPPFVLSAATATLRMRREDDDGEMPNRSHIYGLGLIGVPGTTGYIWLNGYSPGNPNEGLLPEAADPTKTPLIDLAPLLSADTVTNDQRGDAGFMLQVLAKAAKINLYQEHFYKPQAAFGNRSQGITLLKGTLPQLVNAICREWGYRVEKTGENEYVFWSRTWAQDRANDVSERLLTRWRVRLKQHGGTFTLDDRAEMASQLTWPQAKLTLRLALPEAGEWQARREYLSLRLLRRLSPAERAAAATPNGFPLAALSAATQAALIRELDFSRYARLFNNGAAGPTAAEISRARLTWQPPTPSTAIALNVTGEDGATLWSVVKQ